MSGLCPHYEEASNMSKHSGETYGKEIRTRLWEKLKDNKSAKTDATSTTGMGRTGWRRRRTGQEGPLWMVDDRKDHICRGWCAVQLAKMTWRMPAKARETLEARNIKWVVVNIPLPIFHLQFFHEWTNWGGLVGSRWEPKSYLCHLRCLSRV